MIMDDLHVASISPIIKKPFQKHVICFFDKEMPKRILKIRQAVVGVSELNLTQHAFVKVCGSG